MATVSFRSQKHRVWSEPIDAAHITGPLELSTKLLIGLVECPEDQSTDIEEDGDRLSTSWKREGPGGWSC